MNTNRQDTNKSCIIHHDKLYYCRRLCCCCCCNGWQRVSWPRHRSTTSPHRGGGGMDIY